uniref:Uncharacterized protein n=1 Tax=Macaca mulatta TaxID=9544 RepID=A0A5F8A603_MACMU
KHHLLPHQGGKSGGSYYSSHSITLAASHEASAARKENAGEDPGLARQAPKPRKQRASLLEKGLEGAKNTLGGLGNLGKDAVEDLESVGKGAVHDVKDVLDSVL